ncbi:hypothetical protein [Leptolyngbya sp. CCY15150]|nr:hypothetical protein [Leptolyngbya sp. CCY15150]
MDGPVTSLRELEGFRWPAIAPGGFGMLLLKLSIRPRPVLGHDG